MTEQRSGTFFVKGEKIVLKRDGTWTADGIEITHDQTRELFCRAIHWDPREGKYCLKVGYETIYIEVEDTPFFVKSLQRPRRGEVSAELSDGRSVAVRAAALSYSSGALYLALDDGQKAKFLSAPYYDLLRDLEEDESHYFIVIAGERCALAARTEPPPVSRGRPSGKGH